jgi:cell division protein FtsB
MDFLVELRYRIRHVIGPVIGICVLAYVAYHAVNGDRGLIAWRTYEKDVARAKAELERVSGERRALAEQVRLLHPESLDPDMLEEWARRLLNYGHPDEIVIITGNGEGKGE